MSIATVRSAYLADVEDDLINVDDGINEALDFIHLVSLAGEGVKGEIGSAFVRAAASASDALFRARLSLKDARKAYRHE